MTKQLSLSPEVLESRIAPAAAVFDLGNINGANGFVVNGEQADDQIASSVSAIGDFNGDRLPDFVVGAPEISANGSQPGGAYVIFGTANGLPASLDLAALNGLNGFKIIGEAAGDDAGFSISGAGDFNGDGRADIIIGAPGASVAGVAGDIGAAYVLYGAAKNPASLTLSDLVGTGVKILGEAADAGFGYSVAGAGDFNNDGFDDVIIGAPTSSGPSGAPAPVGAAYVIFGAKGFPTPVSVTVLTDGGGFKIIGENVGDAFGVAVAGGADVNGDEVDDIVIGATGLDSGQPGTGGGYVIFGGSRFAAAVTLPGLNGTNGFKFTGETSGDDAGASVALGDLNGDTLADVIIGAPGGGTVAGAGAVHVIYGNSVPFTATVDLSSIAGSSGFKLVGGSAEAMAGFSVTAAGDFNGDGIGDLLIGAPGVSANGELSGAAYLVLGSKTGFADSVDLASLNGTNGFRIDGAAAGHEAGFAVSAAGDVNGDGYGDLLVGARGAGPAGNAAGAAYVIYGFDTRLNPSTDGKTFTFEEADGDIVTLNLSQPGLRMQDIVLAPDGSIASVDLSAFGSTSEAQAKGAKPLNFILQVKTPGGGSGNGLTKLGELAAQGVSMGKVKIAGDLGHIMAGGFGKHAVKSLSVFGNLGGDGLFPQVSKLTGAMKVLKIGGNLQNDTFEITGKLGTLSVGKSLLGFGSVTLADAEAIATRGLDAFLGQGNAVPAGLLLAESMGKMKIALSAKGASIVTTKSMGVASFGGDFDASLIFGGEKTKGVTIAGKMVSNDPNAPSVMSARNKIGFLRVDGDVTNARILAGYNSDEQPVNPDAQIGRVLVKGDWSGSSLVAGIADATNDGFGRNDTVISGDTTPDLESKIASVVIKGTATGSATPGDHFGITAQQIGKVVINGTPLVLSAEATDDILIDTTNSDLRVIEIG